MSPNTKSFLWGMVLGVSAFTLLMRPCEKEEKNNNISKYWENVGKYLNKGIADYEKEQKI